MMKRILSLLMALLVICLCPAHAENDVYTSVWEALYRIVLRTEEGDVTLGSAVLFSQPHVLLTSASCCQAGEIYAIGADGEHPIIESIPLEETGAALLHMLTPSDAQPLPLAGYDVQSLPCIFGADALGNIGASPLYNVLHAMHRGQRALQLYGEEGLLPGAVVVDGKGQIVALVVDQKMEGAGMYTALEPEGLYAAIYQDSSVKTFLPLEITWHGGWLNIAWEDEMRTAGSYLLTLTSADNGYYTSYEAAVGDRSIRIAVPVGHTYYMQVQWAESPDKAQAFTWSAADAYTVPDMPFAQYGYRQTCHLASVPQGQQIRAMLPEMPLISVDTLTAGQELFLQVSSSYDVAEPIQLPMTVSLVAPDGQFYFEELLCTLSPDVEQEDTFVLPMDELFSSCRNFSGQGQLQPGEYVISVTLGGKTAGEYAFTVHPAGTLIPAEQTTALPESGFVSNIAVTQEKGMITLDWSECQIPEGKRVTAYILYDGNTYYTFSEPEQADITSASFPVLPGVGCMVWAAYGDEEHPNLLPQSREQCVLLQAIPKQPFTLHDFTNLRSGVAASEDPRAAEKASFLPDVPLTRAQITGGMHIYFQTEDIYAVTEQSADHVLLVALHTPEGLHFITAGGYTFDPAFQASDLWLLEITELFDSYEELVHTELWPAGEYTIGYYIDGQVVTEITFALE